MFSGIIGKKLGMTRFVQESGEVVSVTAVEVKPCVVAQVKSKEKDGYTAIQLASKEVKNINSPERGHLKDLGNFSYLREFRVGDVEDVHRGDKIDCSFLERGDLVDIKGLTKGKGFAGTIKRHHFHRGPKTHGQSDRERAPGSIGGTTFPGKVLKGKRMAGHLGNRQMTLRNATVVQSDPDRDLLLLKGSVPGANGGLLIIRKAGI